MTSSHSHSHASMKPTGSRPLPAATPHDDVYRLNGGLDSRLAAAVPQKRPNHGIRAALQRGAG